MIQSEIIISASPHPVIANRRINGPEMVNARSGVVRADHKIDHANISYDFKQLKKSGQGGQGGQGGIKPITHVRARACFLFLYFCFIENSIDHLDQASIGVGLYPDH
jgi:hypothetical protein